MNKKILIDEKVLRQALDDNQKYSCLRGETIMALVRALDAAENVEPVAWRTIYDGSEGTCSYEYNEMGDGEPLYTHPAPAVPEGWVPVPREPNKTIIDALHGYEINDVPTAIAAFKAMLSAAPTPPTKTDELRNAARAVIEAWNKPDKMVGPAIGRLEKLL